MSLYENQDVRRDMERVRRMLSRQNPRGYSVPAQVVYNGSESMTIDVLPLYFLSSVAHRRLPELGARDDSRYLKIPGRTETQALHILFAYCNGNSRASNWAADLEECPEMAPYVWELAQVFDLSNLERFTRRLAFDPASNALNVTTACMLYMRSARYPQFQRLALIYICYHFTAVVSERAYFLYLTYTQLRDILISQHLRATERQKYRAICVWHQGPTPGDDVDADEYDRQLRNRGDRFYRLIERINFPLIDDHEHEILRYRDWGQERQTLPAYAAEKTQRVHGRTRRYCFRLKPLLDKLREHRMYHETPRFRGQFQYDEYYWQLEVAVYDSDDRGAIAGGRVLGMYLRLLHGTDMAGRHCNTGVVGLQTRYTLRLHRSGDMKQCYRAARFDADMLNLPRGNLSHGYREFVGQNSCENLLRGRSGRKPDLHASVDMELIREIPPRHR